MIEFFTADQRPTAPGIRTVPTPGHTPGHTSLLITDPASAERLLILGDAVHTRAQWARPEWRFRSDVDPRLGAENRSSVMELGRGEGTIIAGGHSSDGVFGRIDDAGRWRVEPGSR